MRNVRDIETNTAWKYEAKIEDKENKSAIWLSVNTCNVSKERAEKAIAEVERALANIECIMAG